MSQSKIVINGRRLRTDGGTAVCSVFVADYLTVEISLKTPLGRVNERNRLITTARVSFED
jgi:hypothetical protein